MSKRSLASVVAGMAAVPTLLLAAAAPAAAAGDGSVQVSNTETVQAYLDASGNVDVARVYEQVAMQGTRHGRPAATRSSREGLRNLDGFGDFEVADGVMVASIDVDGEQRLRTVSDYTRKLPLEVRATYTLDGQVVEPGRPPRPQRPARGALHGAQRHGHLAGRDVRRRHGQEHLHDPRRSSSPWSAR